MHGLALIYILRDIPEINAFKIVQESLDVVKIWVVAQAVLDAALISKIEQNFKGRLGQSVSIIVEQVDQIPPEKSGKFRYVISKVAHR